MLLECTECQLPYYNFEDLEEHYEITHPEIHCESKRLDVRIIRRILNLHQKTYRCGHCYRPFPHPELRDEHVELSECDPEDDSDCEREQPPRRASLGSLVGKFKRAGRSRRGSATSSKTQ
ncbi:hypothetical protein C8R47DRAFT_1065507 [Mycena vitilis]|nr:hypothetical protein C8R47DRAFT_1065507 [Mycena vitilis]